MDPSVGRKVSPRLNKSGRGISAVSSGDES